MSSRSSNADTQMWEVFNKFHYLCDTHRYQKMLARADIVRQIRDVPGDIVDCGTFKGVSTLQFAHFLKIYRPHGAGKVVSFDTFEAMFPKVRADEMESAKAHMEDLYEESAFAQLTDAVEKLQLADIVTIVQGDITETLPAYIASRPGFRISLLHCDLDVYPATKSILELAWPRIVPGGIVLFDQYAVENWGEADAADEFFATFDNPPRVKILEGTPTPTAYAIKERY
ncbi:MAG: class I SAM-dependent methyltransferase [Alphaproteobacteria bacterium]|nr:class I SAM-dependent methyltransferase [Alphaproteobacteria bacterium]